MLIKYLFCILILVLLVCGAKASIQTSENFKDVSDDITISDVSKDYSPADSQIVEVIENKELIGSFKLDNID